MKFDLIAFDADDTLWHNETKFSLTQAKFFELLADYASAERISRQLYETELRNLSYFGYGIKGFTLSMIETAIELTERRIDGTAIQQIIDLAKAMVHAPIELLDHVAEVIPTLAESYRLMLITKGDLFDQEAKLARSGLGRHFTYVEIVSDKTPASYRALFAKYAIDRARFLMVGNSLRSDILPVTALGAQAVYIPYHLTWAHETVAEQDASLHDYVELEHMGLLPGLIEWLQDHS
jgi:putative hydrolase of the HAD superfamily